MATTIKSLTKTMKALAKDNKRFKKSVIDVVKQEYLAYLFIDNSNEKLHSQLKKDISNDYSKGNTEAYPSNIHKALTLMNKYKPLQLYAPAAAAQGTVFVTRGGNGGEGNVKTLPDGYLQSNPLPQVPTRQGTAYHLTWEYHH